MLSRPAAIALTVMVILSVSSEKSGSSSATTSPSCFSHSASTLR